MKPALIGLLGLLVAGLAAGAARTLPFEIELAAAPVELALDDAQVDVIVEPGVQAAVRAHIAPGAAGAPPGFQISQTSGRTRIERTVDEAAGEVATVFLEVTLDPGQSLVVGGRHLSVAIRNPPRSVEPARPAVPVAGGGEGEAEPPPAAASQRYELVDSELFTTGAATTSLIADNTVIDVEDSSGDLTAQLTGGSLSVRRHHGALHLASTDAEGTVEDLEGAVDFTLDGGSLKLGSGTGVIRGSSSRGFVSCERWRGGAVLTGEDATFELRDGQAEPLQLDTKGTDVRIDGLRGPITAKLEGGEIVAESGAGMLQINAEAGAGIEVSGHDGALTVGARGESTAELTQVKGQVTATLDRSTLSLTGADNLNLTANGSRVTAAGIRRLSGCVTKTSELVLDLSEVEERTLDLRVTDGSTVEVTLRSPCQVQLHESAAASQQVDVTGCELQLQRTGRWRGGMRRDADGRPPFLLTAKVAPTGLLRVRGGP